MDQQKIFAFKPARKPCERAVDSHHAMARHDDGVRVLANGCTYGANGVGIANVVGDVAIRAGVAVGNALQGVPHSALKWGAPCGMQWHVKGMALAAEIFCQLLGGCF